MGKPKTLKTLDEETFKWIKNQKTLNIPGRPPGDDRKRQRYFSVRNVARKEIADLTKLAKMLPDDQVDQIFNIDTLKPIVDELLCNQIHGPSGTDRAKTYLERSKIAQLFIRSGFDYLSTMKPIMMTSSHRRTVEEADDLSLFLLESFHHKPWEGYKEAARRRAVRTVHS